ncbi:hypothetical protein JXA34_02090 [Patescibacteria group bacterium]|nr:hypothetical protein [Patescibacteria group bacterium]
MKLIKSLSAELILSLVFVYLLFLSYEWQNIDLLSKFISIALGLQIIFIFLLLQSRFECIIGKTYNSSKRLLKYNFLGRHSLIRIITLLLLGILITFSTLVLELVSVIIILGDYKPEMAGFPFSFFPLRDTYYFDMKYFLLNTVIYVTILYFYSLLGAFHTSKTTK